MTISHHDHQPSYLSAIMPFIHDANLPPNPPPLPLPLCLSAIMSISHPPLPLKNHAHQPSYLKAIMPISHLAPPFSQYANNPSSASQKLCPSAIIPKSHYANQPPCFPPPSAYQANQPP